MAKVSPKNNLDPNSAPWGRYVDSTLDDLSKRVTRTAQGVQNANQQLNAQVNYIARQLTGGAGTLSDASLLTIGTLSRPVDTTSGNFSSSISSLGARTNTLTDQPVQLYIDAQGNLGISASTLAKKNITGNYAVDMQKFLGLGLKTWAYKDNPAATGMGPIANDLDAAGLKEFVIYNLDGSIQGVRTDMLLVGLWSAYVQSRTATLTEFAKRAVQTVTNSAMTALGINAEKTYTITWPVPFADTNYAVVPTVTSGGAALAAIAAYVPGSKTTTTCQVTVRTLGIALLANSVLTVDGIHI